MLKKMLKSYTVRKCSNCRVKLFYEKSNMATDCGACTWVGSQRVKMEKEICQVDIQDFLEEQMWRDYEGWILCSQMRWAWLQLYYPMQFDSEIDNSPPRWFSIYHERCQFKYVSVTELPGTFMISLMNSRNSICLYHNLWHFQFWLVEIIQFWSS